jgi:hypothetical protein
MPVEDINYLYENSVKENIVIFVDSSKRNKLNYPNIAEFQIDFHEPFTFVYGIDILDTTIPRTTFMIDNYNNKLVFKEATNLSYNNIDYKTVEFTLQDFTSAEAFFQRINEQLEYHTNALQIDNYENIFDNSIYEQRAKSDYPILRFVNSKSFFLDMNLSSTMTVFGFNQIPNNAHFSKYLSLFHVLNNRVNVNNIDNTYTSPHESSKPINFHTNTVDTILNSEIQSSLNTLRFNYTHSSINTIGSFMQSIKVYSNKTFINELYNVSITIKNLSKNVTVIENFQNIFLNSLLFDSNGYTIDFETFSTVNTRSQLMLENNDEYEIVIHNVYIEHMVTNALTFKIVIDYIYFANIHNVPQKNDTLYFSKPIYDASNITISMDLSMDTNRFILDFNDIQNLILSNISLYPCGTVSNIRLAIQTDLSISLYDIFVLRMTKIFDNTSEHICEFILSLHVDSDNNYFLVFNNDKIDYNVFSYVNFDISSNISDTNYFLNVSYEFKLFSSRSVTFVNSHQMEYTFFKEFSLISPGMLNLASENYITLRCDEIENHLRGSHYMKELSPGLGVLNIDVQGYASGRTEFFSVKYKEFHPIGKLSKMKFRFERKSDGNLYDFKNIDLHFLMSIKYLKPIQKRNFEQSVLNPNYNPNYLGYFNKTLHDLYDVESSDDDSDIGEEYFDETFDDRENELVHKMNRSQI